jgi:hypothetical protein
MDKAGAGREKACGLAVGSFPFSGSATPRRGVCFWHASGMFLSGCQSGLAGEGRVRWARSSEALQASGVFRERLVKLCKQFDANTHHRANEVLPHFTSTRVGES